MVRLLTENFSLLFGFPEYPELQPGRIQCEKLSGRLAARERGEGGQAAEEFPSVHFLFGVRSEQQATISETDTKKTT